MNQMADPSHGVAQQLQNHVHLISGNRYPLSPALNIDHAFRYLSDAPTVVKQLAPMAWQYVTCPQDGTLWLEWIPPRGGEYRFASDGYVWGDQEISRREEFGGYTIEAFMHAVGYRPKYDQMATHARTRYHLVAKHPSANAPPPDPNLWLVHYHTTDQHRFLPVSSVPVNPRVSHQMNERRWLESQGRIERKDFMLHDREKWPYVTLPGHMPQPAQGGLPGVNPMLAQQQQMAQQRHPSYPWPQGAGQPAAKRPRHSGPAGPPGSSDGPVDTSIEDEENVSLGDYFDHLSQRDISTTRYMQHHRWMEEIFSSPYASKQIVPPDLGLGLMGALKGLTEGILDPPSIEDINSTAAKPAKAKEAAPFTNLKKEQLDEFNTRVQKHLDEGQAEIERMKKEHAEKMAELKKGSVLMQAQKRLRNATWKDRGEVDAAFRLDGITDGDGPRETVEDIVKEVEESLGVRITGYEDATLVEKGGLEEKEEQREDESFNHGQQEAQMQGMQPQQPQQRQHSATNVLNGAASVAPSASVGKTETEAQALASKVPQDLPQPNYQGDPQGQPPVQPTGGNSQHNTPGQFQQDDMFGDGGGMDMGDTSLMEGMGMDVDVDNGGIDTSNIDFAGQPTTEAGGQANTSAAPSAQAGVATTVGQQQQPQVQDFTAQTPATTAPTTIEAATSMAAATSEGTPTTTQQPLTSGGDVFSDPTISTGGGSNFQDNTFDELGSIGNDTGLGDVDFGMDDSAFGDAMHGMDDAQGS